MNAKIPTNNPIVREGSSMSISSLWSSRFVENKLRFTPGIKQWGVTDRVSGE